MNELNHRDLSGRIVDAEALVRVLLDAEEEGRTRKLSGDMRQALLRQRAEEYVRIAPVAPIPVLVGITEAAEILKTAKPRLYRYREQERMPPPVMELLSGPIFLKTDIEMFAVELERERRERAAGRSQREAGEIARAARRAERAAIEAERLAAEEQEAAEAEA